MNYEYTPLYYPRETLVRFWNYELARYAFGIAFQEKIYFIYLDQNLVYNIEDIISKAKGIGLHFDDAIVELN